MSATAAGHGLVFEDLLYFPDDGFKRELIGGRLVVTPDQPTLRHQRVVGRISATILAWTDERGGEVFPGANVDPAVGEHMEPDVVFLGPDFAGAANERSVLAAPDLVVEVSSPSTRRYDLGDKRLWYERQGVPEYWFVDLDVDRFRIYRLDPDGRYPAPALLERGATFASRALPGLVLDVDVLLGPPSR